MNPNHQNTRNKKLNPIILFDNFFKLQKQSVHLPEQLIGLWEHLTRWPVHCIQILQSRNFNQQSCALRPPFRQPGCPETAFYGLGRRHEVPP